MVSKYYSRAKTGVKKTMSGGGPGALRKVATGVGKRQSKRYSDKKK